MRQRAWPRTIGEIKLLAQVLGVLIAVWVLLPCVKLSRLLRWLDASPGTRSGDPEKLAKAAEYTDALLRRLRFFPRKACLLRSLTLYSVAKRSGIQAQIHCGVRREEGKLVGHAWLSLNGRPLLEKGDPAESYAITFSHPASSSLPTAAQAAPHRSSAWPEPVSLVPHDN